MRFFLTILFASLVMGSSAQFNTDLKKEPTFVFHTTSIDLKTVQDILNTSFGDAVGRWGSPTKDNYSGFGASYIQGVTNHLDFMASLNGALVWYPFRKGTYEPGKKLLLEGDVAVNIKILTDQSWLVPYITLGIGAYRGSNAFGAYAPIGIGLQARVSPKISLFGNFQYRAPVTAEAAHHLLYNFGAGIPIGIVFKNKTGGKAKNYNPPAPYKNASDNVKMVIKDTDADGVEDESDRCPTVKGPATNNGCPLEDADGDGVPDAIDKCPNTPGFLKYDGCPLPDKDNDGIADDFDKCPDVAGFQKYQGCPGPDSDRDGVPDETDKCPLQAGPASNNGCPVTNIPQQVVPETKPGAKVEEKTKEKVKDEPKTQVKKEPAAAGKDSSKTAVGPTGKKQVKGEPLRNIFYDANQSALNELTTYNLEQTFKSLRNNPLWHAQIKGFTDSNEATAEKNKTLATQRAEIIVKYFIGKGIDKSRLIIIDGGIDKNPTFNTPDNAGHRRAEITIVE